MTDFDITKLSDDDLCKAGNRLQRAHDYIEVKGFDINDYGRKGEACCFIGSVKVVTGASTDPSTRSPIATVALNLLDSLADERYQHEPKYPGIAIERQGLCGMFAGCGDYKEQAEVALPTYRQAIRMVQNELERRVTSPIKETA